jgi:hypothetical protein
MATRGRPSGPQRGAQPGRHCAESFTRTSIVLFTEDYRLLRAAALRQGLSVSEVVRRMVRAEARRDAP